MFVISVLAGDGQDLVLVTERPSLILQLLVNQLDDVHPLRVVLLGQVVRDVPLLHVFDRVSESVTIKNLPRCLTCEVNEGKRRARAVCNHHAFW